LILLHYPDGGYVPKPWHGTLLVVVLVVGCFTFNVFLAKYMPIVEGIVFIIHVCGLFAVAIPLWVYSPHKSAYGVFTEFTNNGGWPSISMSFMVGLLPTSVSLTGMDCVVHMGELLFFASGKKAC